MKILISIPIPPSNKYIHRDVFNSALQLKKDTRYETEIITPSNNPFENNLHHIRNHFLKSDCSYWLNIDSDNPPIGNPLDLVALDKDIIGLPTPVWHSTDKKGERPIYWNAYKQKSDAYTEWPIKKGLQEVDAVGTGCVMFSKRLFENKEMQKGCFNRKLNADGTVHKGNDISFCERAKEQGFKIHAHFDYPCYHFNELELNEVVRAFKNLYE